MISLKHPPLSPLILAVPAPSHGAILFVRVTQTGTDGTIVQRDWPIVISPMSEITPATPPVVTSDDDSDDDPSPDVILGPDIGCPD